ncbi:hypothetical protein [Clostridium intestinale]|uniref:Uncharacterized protein n=1 Tax=Clostridium intestinale URNW TaxID=1294142 RepID=U2PYE5_9CLOT|nr:hypothetical protein [Clostridium intestinale]ERK28819.1 hypothetical protein CINTURNW_3928 [Clostridium intestinale URNW]
MNKAVKCIVTFIITFIVVYIIVGYVLNGMFVGFKWNEGVSIWVKLKEYYVRNMPRNVLPTLVISIIITAIINKPKKIK